MYYNNYVYGVSKAGGANNDGAVYKYGPFIENASVSTHSWDNLTYNSFTANGTIDNTGGENCSRRGFCYSSTNPIPTVNNLTVFEDGNFGEGNFQLEITGLFPETIYYYRAYAVNSSGVSYGDVFQLTTEGLSVIDISTLTPEDIQYNSITAIGDITSLNGLSVTQRGFCYSSVNPEPEIYDATVFENGDFTNGEYRLQVEYLMPNTTYYIRSYAASGETVYYGQVITFNTPIEPLRVETYMAYYPNFNSLDVSYGVPSDGGSPVTQRGIIYSTSNDNLTIDLPTKTNDGEGTGYFHSTIRNLESNITYYYRAYAVNANDIAYGAVNEIMIIEPCLYVKVGLEGLYNGTLHKYSTVIVEFRTGATLGSSRLAYRASGIVDNNSRVKINYQYNAIESGNYWIVVRAPGYLPIASNAALAIDNASNTSINFFDNQTSTYNTILTKLINGKYLMKAGDFDANRRVQNTDTGILKPNVGSNHTIIPE